MPKIGDIITDRELGRKGHGRQIWCSCTGCKKEMWVALSKGVPKRKHGLCRYCVNKGERSYMWEGGTLRDKFGYIYVRLERESFFLSMANARRYIKEHRLVMAQSLGRCLQDWEIVHHKNGIKDDNRIENLELTMSGSHTISHNKGYRDGYNQGYYDGSNIKINELTKEIKLLQQQVKSLQGKRVG